MTRYLTSYRFFILSKAGFSLAYLWVCWDFLRINRALEGNLQTLLPALSGETIFDNAGLNRAFISALLFFSQPAAIWIYSILAPLAVGLFIWGQYRWLQVAVGLWLWLSMIGLTARASILMSTADFWLNWSFILYAVSGFVTPAGRWEKSQPSFSRELWRKNPIVESEYALLVVILQFSVYFLCRRQQAPRRVAAVDHRRRHPESLPTIFPCAITLRGLPAPVRHLLRLLLRHPVPATRGSLWLFHRALSRLGRAHSRRHARRLRNAHAGRDFSSRSPLGLLLIIPPRELALPLFSRPSLRRDKRLRHYIKSIAGAPPRLTQHIALILVAAILLLGPIIDIALTPDLPSWTIKSGTLLHWTMFSDGGSSARIRLRVGVRVRDPQTGLTRYDEVSDLPLELPPCHLAHPLLSADETLLFGLPCRFATPPVPNCLTTNISYPYIATATKLYVAGSPDHPSIEKVSLKLAPCDQWPFHD